MSQNLRSGFGTIAATSLVLIAIIAMVGTVAIAQVVVSGQQGLTRTSTEITTISSVVSSTSSKDPPLALVDQTPQTRHFVVDWSNTDSSGQDRFNPPSMTVNQGDTIEITFLANDTDAHTFTLGAPYNFQINDTVPGTVNHLTNQTFTTTATNNSPGVTVSGTPGNITGKGSFVAKSAGIYEYFCVYHVALGMFGYLIVLPNQAYSNSSSVSLAGIPASNSPVVSIDPGSAINSTSMYYSPSTITLILGINNKVSWTNNDDSPHTVVGNSGSFSSGNLDPGQSFQFTFSVPGTYSYHCSYHPWMHGVVVVKQS